MKVIVSSESYERVSNYFKEEGLNIEIVEIDKIRIKENEIYINLYNEKKDKKLKKLINTKGVKIYNYTNNFNRRTIKELFKIRNNNIVNSSIEICPYSNCKYFKKLVKYNPNILFAKISYDKNGKLVKINGLDDFDITDRFLTKLKDVLLNV